MLSTFSAGDVRLKHWDGMDDGRREGQKQTVIFLVQNTEETGIQTSLQGQGLFANEQGPWGKIEHKGGKIFRVKGIIAVVF